MSLQSNTDVGVVNLDRDTVSGPLPEGAGDEITVYENAVRWAGLPVTGTPGAPGFSCRLRPVAEPRISSIEIRDATGSRLFARALVRREVLRNGFGLRASDVFDPAHPPLAALPWIGFDGVTLTIGGAHLPPGGDPSSLSVRLPPGVVASVTCAGSTPDWEQHYWYWPNAGYSGVTVSIDVTSSTYHSDPFHFEFFEKKNGRAQKLSDVWIPNDLRFFLNFTSDRAAVDRVQRGMDASSIVLPGYMAFRYCEDVLRRNGIDPSSRISLLDWGCGVGRVTAHFLRGWPRADVHGIDIDLENVRWCEANLARGHFAAAPLWPPTHYRDGAFDAVVGISVMTHLAANAQAAWLAELARIVRPGGLALLTFSGTSGSAAGSRWCSQEWWDAWKARGFDDETRDPALAGHIDDDDYYRQTSQSAEYVRSHWSKDFEIVDIVQAAFGNQDLAVLRRR